MWTHSTGLLIRRHEHKTDSRRKYPDGNLPTTDCRWESPDGNLPTTDSRWKSPDGNIPMEISRWNSPDGILPLDTSRWTSPDGNLMQVPARLYGIRTSWGLVIHLVKFKQMKANSCQISLPLSDCVELMILVWQHHSKPSRNQCASNQWRHTQVVFASLHWPSALPWQSLHPEHGLPFAQYELNQGDCWW